MFQKKNRQSSNKEEWFPSHFVTWRFSYMAINLSDFGVITAFLYKSSGVMMSGSLRAHDDVMLPFNYDVMLP